MELGPNEAQGWIADYPYLPAIIMFGRAHLLEPLEAHRRDGRRPSKLPPEAEPTYLVLTFIWIFAGLIHPLYEEDQRRAQQLSACLEVTSATDRAVKDCYNRDRTRALARDAIIAFEATYGEVQEWPISIFLVCILPPMLCYGLIRFLLFVIAATVPRRNPSVSGRNGASGMFKARVVGSAP